MFNMRAPHSTAMANMRIRTKILVFVVLPIFLVDLAMTILNCYDNYATFKSLSEAKFLADTRLAAEQVSKENVQGVSIARTAAAAGEIWFGYRPESVGFIRDLLEIFPTFVGASVGYEPNADFNDAKTERGLKNLRDAVDVSEGGGIDAYGLKTNPTKVSVDEWLGRTEGGRFLAYWGRGDASALSIEPVRDTETSMFYAGLKKKTEAGDKEGYVVTEPYLYNNKTLMVEYSAPIMFEGIFAGQMAFDRDLARISELVSSLKTFPGSEIFLISAQSRIIAATKNSALRTVSIDDLYTDETGSFVIESGRGDGQIGRDNPAARRDSSKYGTVYRDLLKSALEMSKSTMAVGGTGQQATYFTDPQTGKVYCVAHAIIRPGNWVMVQMAPRSELLAPVYASIVNEAVGLAVFAIVTLAALALSSRLLSRVTKASELAEEIARGRLDVEIPAVENSQDETRRLMASMGHMAANLRSLISSVSQSAHRLSSYSDGVEKASAEYEESMQNFCSSTGEISAAVKQMTATSAELAKTVETLSDGASKSSETAEDGRAQLSSVEKTMQILSSSTSSIAKRLAIISERANNINAVVVTISKVADETNMLALNASIEAEKAGAYGLGFSVVAREIGRLADQTALATSDIETIVKDMQNAVVAGVSEMDKFAEDVRMGVSDVERIIGGMDTVITKMQSIAPQLESLTEGMNSQTTGVSQISEAMASLNDGVRQAGSLLKQVSDSRSQMREALDALDSEISKFKFGGRS